MAKRKNEQVGQGIGLIAGLALLAVLLAAAALPFFLLFRYLQYSYLSWKFRKENGISRDGWWLSEEERRSFKHSHYEKDAHIARDRLEHNRISELIELEKRNALTSGLTPYPDGKFHGNSKAAQNISGYENQRNRLVVDDYEIDLHQPADDWNDLNDLLKKQNVAFVALLGWVCGAFFFYSAHRQGAPFIIWIDLFVPALCAGVSAGLAVLIFRSPAARYMPKPVRITIANVDSPQIDIPQKNGYVARFAGIILWIGVMFYAGQEGKKSGEIRAVAHKEQIRRQNEMAAENERQMQEAWNMGHATSDSISNTLIEQQSGHGVTPERSMSSIGSFLLTSHFDHIPEYTLSRLNAGQVEEIVLAIYAHSGTEFESASAQQWANQQPWYRRVPGKTISEAEKEFDWVASDNVKRLVARWNQIQVEEGHAPLPVEESPLAGRNTSDDAEWDNDIAPAPVLRALPVEQEPEVIRSNLNPEEITKWSLARVRYEINTIYARHGVIFPKPEIQAYFETKEWYRPVAGLTFSDAESRFSPAEKLDIEMLAARRKAINESE